MAPIPRFIPGCVEIVLHGSGEGSQRANVFHYRYASALFLTIAQLNEMAVNFWNFINSSYTAPTASGYNFDSVVARDIAAAGLNEGQWLITQPHPGGTAQPSIPANATPVISWRTGIASRSGRGRTYVWGLATNEVTGSSITSAEVTALTSLASNIRAFSNSAGTVPLNFVIASFRHTIMHDVNSYIIDTFLDSQRRRLIGRGN